MQLLRICIRTATERILPQVNWLYPKGSSPKFQSINQPTDHASDRRTVPFDAPGSIMVKQRKQKIEDGETQIIACTLSTHDMLDGRKLSDEERASKIPRKRNGRRSTNPPPINHRSDATAVQREQAECEEHRSGPEKWRRERSNRGEKRTNKRAAATHVDKLRCL